MVTPGIADGETPPNRVEAQARAFPRGREEAGVFDLKNQVPGLSLGGDLESEARGIRKEAVFKGIFHNGLEDKTGDKYPAGGGGGGDSGLKFISKTGFLDPEKGGGGIEFNGKRRDQLMPVIEGIF